MCDKPQQTECSISDQKPPYALQPYYSEHEAHCHMSDLGSQVWGSLLPEWEVV